MATTHSDPACIFCKIIAGTIPSFKVIETEHIFAFLDIGPLSKGHTLVIPKYHAAKLHELPSEHFAELGQVLGRVARAVVAATGITDYNILQNNGALAHQAVPHVHFHIIPKPDDAQGLGISWPATSADKAELAALSQELISHL